MKSLRIYEKHVKSRTVQNKTAQKLMGSNKYAMPFCVISSLPTVPMEVMWVQSCATFSRSDPSFCTGHQQIEQ